MVSSLLVYLAVQAFASGTAQHPLSVREVMEHAEALDGREIVVSGWVEECQRLSCALYASRRETHRDLGRYAVSIGTSRWFDAFARGHTPGRVTLRARFSAHCVTDPRTGVLAVCADRADSLVPLAIVR